MININNKKNELKIEKYLASINGSAQAFTVTSVHAIKKIILLIEQRLFHIPKNKRNGILVEYRPCGASSRSYKYSAKSTVLYLRCGSNSWFLERASSCVVATKQPEKILITVNESQAGEIIKKVMHNFIVKNP